MGPSHSASHRVTGPEEEEEEDQQPPWQSNKKKFRGTNRRFSHVRLYCATQVAQGNGPLLLAHPPAIVQTYERRTHTWAGTHGGAAGAAALGPRPRRRHAQRPGHRRGLAAAGGADGGAARRRRRRTGGAAATARGRAAAAAARPRRRCGPRGRRRRNRGEGGTQGARGAEGGAAAGGGASSPLARPTATRRGATCYRQIPLANPPPSMREAQPTPKEQQGFGLRWPVACETEWPHRRSLQVEGSETDEVVSAKECRRGPPLPDNCIASQEAGWRTGCPCCS